jgi:protein involved in polysaccharide export with SLBB domain
VREERVVDTGLEYLPGDRVRVRVVRREGRTRVGDDGAAVERAGRPPGWKDVKERIADELVVNVSRQGTVWLPVVACGPAEDEIVDRIGQASVALHQELLELD